MLNPNQNPVLTFDEKRNAGGVPAQIVEYDETTDTFMIAPDWARYNHEGRDTDFVDFENFNVPAVAIHCFSESGHEYPEGFVGEFILLPY